MAGNEDGRGLDVSSAQLRNQIEAVHSRHVLIDNQTVEFRKPRFRKELLRIRVGANRKSLNHQRKLQ